MTKVYEVYHCYKGDDLLYVGQGARGRSKHCNSGISHVYELNEIFFTEGKEALSVHIVKFTNCKDEALAVERYNILNLKPKYNKVHSLKLSERSKSASESVRIRRELSRFRDDISGKKPSEGFVRNYEGLCRDFVDFYSHEGILENDIKLYPKEVFKELDKIRLSGLSRSIRNTKIDHMSDISFHALFFRAILSLYGINLKDCIYRRNNRVCW